MILINNNENGFYTLDTNGVLQKMSDMPNAKQWLSKIKDIVKEMSDAEKDRRMTFLYRGENRENFATKTGLTSDFNLHPYYNCFFVIGSKAKSYYKTRNPKLLTIKQFDDDSKESYIFDQLSLLSKDDKYHDILLYFNNKNNKDEFLNTLSKIKSKDKLIIQNVYLAFIHTLSSEPMNMKAHSVLLSSSRNKRVAIAFANNGFVIGFWIKQPIHTQAIDYKIIEQYCKLLDQYSLPSINKTHFPDESEVTIFSAIFPHNILFVYDIVNGIHVFNPYIINTERTNIIMHGINVDQTCFSAKIRDIYSRSIWRCDSQLLYENEH